MVEIQQQDQLDTCKLLDIHLPLFANQSAQQLAIGWELFEDHFQDLHRNECRCFYLKKKFYFLCKVNEL